MRKSVISDLPVVTMRRVAIKKLGVAKNFIQKV